jgi:hypothetical protein
MPQFNLAKSGIEERPPRSQQHEQVAHGLGIESPYLAFQVLLASRCQSQRSLSTFGASDLTNHQFAPMSEGLLP